MDHAALPDARSTSCCASRCARFVAREVEPYADAWEAEGRTPREVLRKMGAAGLLGLMYAPSTAAPAPTR